MRLVYTKLMTDQTIFSIREKAGLIHKSGKPRKPVTAKSIARIVPFEPRMRSLAEFFGVNVPRFLRSTNVLNIHRSSAFPLLNQIIHSGSELAVFTWAVAPRQSLVPIAVSVANQLRMSQNRTNANSLAIGLEPGRS